MVGTTFNKLVKVDLDSENDPIFQETTKNDRPENEGLLKEESTRPSNSRGMINGSRRVLVSLSLKSTWI